MKSEGRNREGRDFPGTGSPNSPRKVPSIPPLLLRLIQHSVPPPQPPPTAAAPLRMGSPGRPGQIWCT